METEEKDNDTDGEDFVGGNKLDVVIEVSREGCIFFALAITAILLVIYTIVSTVR